jgi:hypothetical protein
MKKSCAVAAALLAVAIIAFAAAGPLVAGNANDQTGSIASPVQRDLSSGHIYCFVGATGDHSNLHRGWVCIQEAIPASS